MNQGNGKYTALFLLKLGVAFLLATLLVNNVEQLENFKLLAKLLVTILLQFAMVLAESTFKKR